MSIIADRIRAYVNDFSVSDHYGAWGALRPDQRRQIRELCDTCDMFERTADELAGKGREWISVDERLPEREGKYLVYTYKGGVKFGEFRSYLVGEGKLCEPQFDYYVTHWMPLPEPPKMKGGD